MSPLSYYAEVRPELIKRAPTCLPPDGEGGTWRLERGWQERERGWTPRGVLAESRCPGRSWQQGWGPWYYSYKKFRLGGDESGFLGQLTSLGGGEGGRTPRPHRPRDLSQHQRTRACLYLLFFPGCLHFHLPLALPAAVLLDNRKRESTQGTFLHYDRKPRRPASSPVRCCGSPGPTHVLHLRTGNQSATSPAFLSAKGLQASARGVEVSSDARYGEKARALISVVTVGKGQTEGSPDYQFNLPPTTTLTDEEFYVQEFRAGHCISSSDAFAGVGPCRPLWGP